MSLHERLLQSSRFQAFTEQVAAAVAQVCPKRADVVQTLKEEQKILERECAGHNQSLRDPELGQAVRIMVQLDFEKALNRLDEITRELDAVAFLAESKKQAIRPEEIATALTNLADILNGQNAAAMNITLAQHIDRIDCYPDGKVAVRTCLLGAMANAKELLARYGTSVAAVDDGSVIDGRIEPRRLSRRDVGIGIEDEEEAEAVNNFAADPQRFGDLGPEWFAVDEFQEPEYHSWAASNAREVAEYRLSARATEAETATHFEKSIPTIRAALRIAKSEHGIDALGKAVSRPSRLSWSEANAEAVLDYLCEPGRLLKDAVIYFNKSEPTIRKAREFGASLRQGS